MEIGKDAETNSKTKIATDSYWCACLCVCVCTDCLCIIHRLELFLHIFWLILCAGSIYRRATIMVCLWIAAYGRATQNRVIIINYMCALVHTFQDKWFGCEHKSAHERVQFALSQFDAHTAPPTSSSSSSSSKQLQANVFLSFAFVQMIHVFNLNAIYQQIIFFCFSLVRSRDLRFISYIGPAWLGSARLHCTVHTANINFEYKSSKRTRDN